MIRSMLLAGLMMISGVAQAGVITGSGILSNQDVDWYDFSTTGFGLVSISAVQTTLDGSDFDSVLFLFKDDGFLDDSDLLRYDDDSGAGVESFISMSLDIGNYLLAVATHGAMLPLPIHSGHHSGTDYSLSISGDFVTGASVPEPASFLLLGLGLTGLGIRRKRKS